MFCKKCGQKIDDSSEFCKFCGASQTGAASATPVTATKKKGKAKKIWGIVLLALGVLSILGGISSGSLAETFSSNAGLEDIFRLAIQIGFAVGGAYLLYRHGQEK